MKAFSIFKLVAIIALTLIFSTPSKAQQKTLSLDIVSKHLGNAPSGILTYLRQQGYSYNRLDGSNPCSVFANASSPKSEFTICEKKALVIYFSFNVPISFLETYKQELNILKFKKLQTEQIEGKLPQQEYISADNKLKLLMQWDDDSKNLYVDMVLNNKPVN